MAEPAFSQRIDGRKFLWDGKVYDQAADAERAASAYQADKFETRQVAFEGKHLVYTRRVAAQTGSAM